jgi:phosphoribosyl 1,2-cyclic phosphate phosphodiesterase
VDTGPDFRQQVLRAGIRDISCVLYTHIHADHCHGFDDLRAFAFKAPKQTPAYFLSEHIAEFKSRFAYAFQESGYGGAVPQIDAIPIPEGPFQFKGLDIDPIRLPHGHVTTCGFRFGHFAYITDFKSFPEENKAEWRKHVRTMVASGIHYGTHPSHSCIQETIELFRELEVERGIITHLSHRVDFDEVSATLPSNVELAYDGMVIDL